MNNNNNNQKSTSGLSILVSVIFIIWFIASLVCMIYVGKQENKWPLFILFGQYFLVFGLIFVIHNIINKHIYGPEFLVTVIGGLCVYTGIVMPKSTPEEKESFVKSLPFILFGMFIFMGIVAIVNTFRFNSNNKNNIPYQDSTYDNITYNAPPSLSSLVAGIICIIVGIIGILVCHSIL
ncbi:MAG: hypothetical protein J6A25_13490 [Lachnospiraceae bacterium]|nr:hypothetical protein [Lachnospiraceae bacterium]